MKTESNIDIRAKEIEKLKKYKYGFITDIESIRAPKGLNEEVIRFISKIKKEPKWMLDFRLKAFERFKQLKEPNWQKPKYPKINYQDLYYYSAPKSMDDKPKSLDELDPKLLETYKKLGIPLQEQARLNGIAVDAVFDSVSVATTFKGELTKQGIIFCSMSEAIQKHPELVQKYLGSVIPITDHFFATLNSAVFTDGSFVYIPKNTRCPMELSTYFRINASETGQFERTLIIADKGSYVSYLEGCTAPMRDENQLHAAIVELIALDNAEIKYSTVQNWYPGDKDGKGGIYNFVTKRGKCAGYKSKITWTQVETGSAITWKYPSCILQGDESIGEFYSVAFTGNYQQADTGTKMYHIGKNTKSTIISKGISAGHGNNTYRGLVKIGKKADNAKNYTQCDSLMMGDQCGAHTTPYIECRNNTATLEHEATTSKINEDQLFYCKQRGIDERDAINLIVNGFCKDIFSKLPMEFAVEANKLLEVSMEGSIG
jgi:Fe-S cluster assembly protein SufB